MVRKLSFLPAEVSGWVKNRSLVVSFYSEPAWSSGNVTGQVGSSAYGVNARGQRERPTLLRGNNNNSVMNEKNKSS